MDDELIERACAGDREAIGRLYERHATRIYAVVRRLAGDDELAADWAQEAWVRIFRALPRFRGESRFSTWAHRIAVNAALRAGRQHRRRWLRTRDEVPVGEISSPPDQPILRLSLAAAVDALPERMRAVVVLHDIEGYKHQEIAEMLGITAGTSKSHLFKARAKLREMLEPSAPREGERVCTT